MADKGLDLDLLRCPRSKGPLVWKDERTLVGRDCGHEYPVVHGIPDFRLFDPPYATREEERRRVALVEEAAPRMSFRDLIVHYETEILRQPEAKRQKGIDHRLTLPDRSPRRLEALLDAAGFDGGEAGEMILDLGCGSGEAVGALRALSGGRVIGVDISLEELVLARKLLAETGQEAVLVAGCAEALPFPEDLFSFIYSPDVIEHVSDQRDYLAEAARTLRPGGTIVLNSPNRYSLVQPEPHVGLWALGFLPRAWMDPVSRAFGKGPYIGKRLVSLPELRRLVGRSFPDAVITVRRSNPQATSLPGRLFRMTAPWSERLFAQVDHQHFVRARKPDAPGRAAGPTPARAAE
jgi:SAM-dependent methyltransferase/uncharacterized protein YbaR (Trm112 family)